VVIDRAGRRPLIYFTPPLVSCSATMEDTDLLARLCGLNAADLHLDHSPAQIVTFGISF
jgi:hypothetical protein